MGIRKISAPKMEGNVSGELSGGMPGKRAASVDKKKTPGMMDTKPMDIDVSSKFFTNDTLVMDTTPGMSGEDKRRRKQKEKMGQNIMQSSMVNMYEA
jgi:hypothetical protein